MVRPASPRRPPTTKAPRRQLPREGPLEADAGTRGLTRAKRLHGPPHCTPTTESPHRQAHQDRPPPG
eukprot:2405906-Pyramimonas_sp.AAC.1